MESSMAWAIESFFIEIYSVLVHRIKGIGWTIDDFMKMDTWVTSKLYCMELDLIDQEENELNKDKNDPTLQNNPEVEELYEEMFDET